jgi:hypothetical protein
VILVFKRAIAAGASCGMIRVIAMCDLAGRGDVLKVFDKGNAMLI